MKTVVLHAYSCISVLGPYLTFAVFLIGQFFVCFDRERRDEKLNEYEKPST